MTNAVRLGMAIVALCAVTGAAYATVVPFNAGLVGLYTGNYLTDGDLPLILTASPGDPPPNLPPDFPLPPGVSYATLELHTVLDLANSDLVHEVGTWTATLSFFDAPDAAAPFLTYDNVAAGSYDLTWEEVVTEEKQIGPLFSITGAFTPTTGFVTLPELGLEFRFPGPSFVSLGADDFQYEGNWQGELEVRPVGNHEVVPEPATLLLFGLGSAGLVWTKRHLRHK